VPIDWTTSADRHGIPHEDVIYAMRHATGHEEVQSPSARPGDKVFVYVGHPHAQTERYIEVIAVHRHPRQVIVFHAMELSDHYRHLTVEGK
jgi:hypothetical protein